MGNTSATTGHDVVMYEDSGGGLHIEAANRVYSGIEHVDAGPKGHPGLGLMIEAALALQYPGGTHPSRPISEYMQDGEFIAPGEVIAVYDPTTHPQSAQIVIYPFRCGDAGRRLLGLPTND